MRHLLLLSAILIIGPSLLEAADEPDNGLPGIWSAIGDKRQYHTMFQIQMLNASERLTFEEWASFESGKHRLDLISDNGRTTYLTNTKTGEIFMYRPYTCSLLKQDANELQTLAALLRGFPIGNSEDSQRNTLAYGMGPLWLNVKEQADKVVQIPMNSGYDVYSVSLKKDQSKDFEYKLRYYFKKGVKFVDSVEWISGMTRNAKVMTQVRSKTIQIPTSDEQIADEIFDLPVGYGCVRIPDFDHPFSVKLGPAFLHEGAPNKAILEVSLSYPTDATHHSWQTNRYSLSLMRGTMRLNELTRSYYASLVQYRHPLTGKLIRQRKIWSDSSESQATALLYSINPDTGDCRASHAPSSERLRLEFPTATAIPIRISLDLLDWLFNNWDNFHLIDEKPSVLSLILKQARYELRMPQLRLNEKSEPIWSGPVSVVKEISLMGQYVTYPFNINDIKLFESYHTKVTVFFYSDDLTQVRSKITFDLFENSIIDVNHMQRQLDVSLCLPEQRRHEIVVEYPIQEEEARSSLVSMQNVLLDLFVLNLYSSTPIDPLMVSNFGISFDQFNMFIRFNLLDVPLWQSYQMKQGLSLGKGDSVYEKASASVENCAESCEQHSCVRFAFDPVAKKCQLQVGFEDSLHVTGDNKDSSLFEAPKLIMHSPWTDLDPNGGRRYLRPHEQLELLRQFVAFKDEDGETRKEALNVPLTIRIERSFLTGEASSREESIELRPFSIHSNLDDMVEILRIGGPTSGQDSAGELLFLGGSHQKLRAEYSVLLEDRDYTQGKEVGEEFAVSSYDECALQCDDYNCRSFSFCETTKKCIVSRMHNNTQLEKSSRHAFTCKISVLDYLSKFESFGASPLPAKAKREITGRTERECAHLCVEDRTIDCQAFYFCPSADLKRAPPKCYLESTHIHDINSMGLDSLVAYQLVTGAFKSTASRLESQPCRFYSRSYLAQFHQFVGKSLDSLLDANPEATDLLQVETNLGPDACARKCVERSCVGFDVCLTTETSAEETETKTKLVQTCRLSQNSIKRSDLSSKRPACSAFVLSDRSHFGSPNATIIDLSRLADYKALDRGSRDGSSQEMITVDAEQTEAEANDIMSGLMKILSGSVGSGSVGRDDSIVGGSHWLSKTLSICVGLALGVVCAIFLARGQFELDFSRLKATIFGR